MGLDIYLFGVPELLLSYQHSILSEMKKKKKQRKVSKTCKRNFCGSPPFCFQGSQTGMLLYKPTMLKSVSLLSVENFHRSELVKLMEHNLKH